MAEVAIIYPHSDAREETSPGFSKTRDWYSSQSRADRTGADVIRPYALLPQKHASKNYPIWEFQLDAKPLSALVSHEEGHWFAEIEWLDVFGEGLSPQEAIEDLELHIGHFIEFYAAQETDSLTEHALTLQNRFLSIQRA